MENKAKIKREPESKYDYFRDKNISVNITYTLFKIFKESKNNFGNLISKA